MGSKRLYFATVGVGLLYPVASFGGTGDAAGAGEILYSVLTSLFLILGAGAAALFFLRRWKGNVGRREGPLQLEHLIALGPRERLALVRVGTRWFVVGITPTVISKIAELPEAPAESPKQTGETSAGLPSSPA
jgi:flagellar biogenesis protein FliO